MKAHAKAVRAGKLLPKGGLDCRWAQINSIQFGSTDCHAWQVRILMITVMGVTLTEATWKKLRACK
jgi:hypothetical protein